MRTISIFLLGVACGVFLSVGYEMFAMWQDGLWPQYFQLVTSILNGQ